MNCRKIAIFALLSFSCVPMIPARAASPSLLVESLKLEFTGAQKGIVAGILQAASSKEGQAAITAAAASLQVPPEEIGVVSELRGLRSAIQESGGHQDNYVKYPLPSGYAFCASKIKVSSAVPKGSDDTSAVAAWASVAPPGNPDQIVFYGSTPRATASGETSIMYTADFLLVRQDLQNQFIVAGRCAPPSRKDGNKDVWNLMTCGRRFNAPMCSGGFTLPRQVAVGENPS